MSSPVHGYTNRILRVDLSKEQITEESLEETILRNFIGGTGLGAYLLYRDMPPGFAWDHPLNPLILASGPLGGAPIAGAGSFSVVTKGSLTNGATSTQANGYFGAYMKFSGFDAVVIQGIAPRWLYLYVHDGGAELKEASELRGKDTWETEESIKQELGKRAGDLSVYAIGPAGENLVKFAAIVGDRGHVAAHNGVGAVMGSKKLKAVVAGRGRGEIKFRDRSRLSALGKQMIENMREHPVYGMLYEWGTSMLYPGRVKDGSLPVRNLTTNLFPDFAKFCGDYYRSRFRLKLNPCWACPTHHCHLIEVTEGPYKGYTAEEPEYECWAAWSSLIGQTDPGAAVMLSDTVDRLGLDCNESGWLMAFVMECYEKGIITQKETEGLEMTWGNAEAARAMLNNIARRQGFGNVLAEGVKRSAEHLGGEALNMAVYLGKGHAPRGHDHRARWSEILDCATSGTGTIESGPVPIADPFSPEAVSTTVAKRKSGLFVDSLVMCMFPTMTMGGGGVNHLVEMLNTATGWDMTMEEANTISFRIVNLLRAFNIRHGVKPDVEYPSSRYSSAPVDGPIAGKSIRPYWEDMLNSYYQHMGWDRTSGRPLPETLKSVGLEDIVSDIW